MRKALKEIYDNKVTRIKHEQLKNIDWEELFLFGIDESAYIYNITDIDGMTVYENDDITLIGYVLYFEDEFNVETTEYYIIDCEIDRIDNCKNEDKIIINDTEIILDAYVNKKVDKVFYDIIEDFEIKTGDITPMQSDDVNQFKITIKQYIKQNLGLNEECDLNGE